MRFAISGQPAKSEAAEQAPAPKQATGTTSKPETDRTAAESVKNNETKEPASETKKPAEKTNDSTKIEASTGS